MGARGLTHERVRELFDYNKTPGELIRKFKVRGSRTGAGEPAGGLNKKGYLRV